MNGIERSYIAVLQIAAILCREPCVLSIAEQPLHQLTDWPPTRSRHVQPSSESRFAGVLLASTRPGRFGARRVGRHSKPLGPRPSASVSAGFDGAKLPASRIELGTCWSNPPPSVFNVHTHDHRRRSSSSSSTCSRSSNSRYRCCRHRRFGPLGRVPQQQGL